MSVTTETLCAALQACDMLEIDGLHAFDFSLDPQQLLIECMDGRVAKHWRFSLAQVRAARYDAAQSSWNISDDSGEHRLVCMAAFSASNDEEDEHVDA